MARPQYVFTLVKNKSLSSLIVCCWWICSFIYLCTQVVCNRMHLYYFWSWNSKRDLIKGQSVTSHAIWLDWAIIQVISNLQSKENLTLINCWNHDYVSHTVHTVPTYIESEWSLSVTLLFTSVVKGQSGKRHRLLIWFRHFQNTHICLTQEFSKKSGTFFLCARYSKA